MAEAADDHPCELHPQEPIRVTHRAARSQDGAISWYVIPDDGGTDGEIIHGIEFNLEGQTAACADFLIDDAGDGVWGAVTRSH